MLLEDKIATLNNTLDAVENNLISKELMSKYLYPILEILTLTLHGSRNIAAILI